MFNPIADYFQTRSRLTAGLTRRHVVFGTVGLAASAGVGLGRISWAQTPLSPTTAPTQTAWRAMSRVGYGPSPSLSAEVQTAASPQAWALQQIELAYAASHTPPVIATDLVDFNAPLPQLFAAEKLERELRKQIKTDKGSTALDPTPDKMDATARRLDFSAARQPEFFNRQVSLQTAAWRLASCSLPGLENPLLARMTEFWFNHLNVYVGKGAVRPFVGHYLVNAIRAHAMGKFEDLLLASARHPAMLLYLDQARSVAEVSKGPDGKGRGLNENYARELMELHTLGVNGGYSQADVRELARVLTGWTIGPQAATGFRFAPMLHDNGNKQVLGQSFPMTWLASGEQEGVDAIRMLARHPATARRICLRLAQFFVADMPSPALVAQLSQTFTDSHGDISNVLRTLLSSSDFWAPENRLFKTPMDFACSALTATQSAAGRDRRGLVLATGYLTSAGQPLHGWQTPDGYAFDAATWLAPEALTRRADFALALTRQSAELDFLTPYLAETTRQTIAKERPAMRAGMMLASPDFMYK
jgi:uncharacterized protein (DUF1800 family)